MIRELAPYFTKILANGKLPSRQDCCKAVRPSGLNWLMSKLVKCSVRKSSTWKKMNFTKWTFHVIWIVCKMRQIFIMYSKYQTTLLKISTPKYPFQKFCFKGECGENLGCWWLGEVCNERGRRVFRFLCSKMGVKSAQESLLSQKKSYPCVVLNIKPKHWALKNLFLSK